VASLRAKLAAPVLLMGYLNPFLAHGITDLARDAAEAGVAGFIIPDLPLEHAGDIRESLAVRGIALVNLVTPVSTPERVARLARSSRGFLYAVTRTGITGGETAMPAETTAYLAALGAQSRVPVIAGFGIRSAAQVQALAPHVDGVVVGTALLEAIGRGEDPAAFVRGLR
jgi:tryptophan synthase alpha chain